MMTVINMEADTQDRPASLADTVYTALHSAILQGQHRPNERLVEAELATELGASRTPIREALQRLASEGLVIKGRQGFQVREFTIAEIREVYEVRMGLEGCAARLAAGRITEDELTCLDELVDDHREFLGEAVGLDVPRIVAINDRLHDAVVVAAGNARLAALIRANHFYYFNFQLATLYARPQLEVALKDHEWLCESLRRRDGDMAEMITRRHITTAFEVIENSLTQST